MTIAPELKKNGSFSRQGFIWTFTKYGQPGTDNRFGMLSGNGHTPEEAVDNYNREALKLNAEPADGGRQQLPLELAQEFDDFADALYLNDLRIRGNAKNPVIRSGRGLSPQQAKSDLDGLLMSAVHVASKVGMTVTIGGEQSLQAVLPGSRVSKPVVQLRPIDGYVSVYSFNLPVDSALKAIQEADRLAEKEATARGKINRQTAYMRYRKEGLV